MQRTCRFALAATLALGFLSQVAAQDVKEGQDLTLLFTTDLYGRFRDVTCGEDPPAGDYANLVAEIERIEKELTAAGQPQPLVLNGGDNIGPHAFSRFLLGRGKEGARLLCGWMKKAGYELVALGNQDFYAVPERLLNYLEQGKKAGLVFSAANLDCADPEKGACRYLGTGPKHYRMFERGGIEIAVLSVIHKDLAEQVQPSHLEGISVANPYERARDVSAAAREDGADLVIVLSHLDHSETSPRRALKLARTVAGADLIIANGFTSAPGERGIGVIRFSDGATPIIGSDLYGEHLGRADLKLVREGEGWRVADLEATEIDPRSTPADEGVRAELEAEHRGYCEQWDKPAGEGRLEKPMPAAEFEAYLMEILRYETRSELAFINRGLVDSRTVFPLEGRVTRHDIFSALPHRNQVYNFDLTVEELTGLCAKLANEKQAGEEKVLLFRGLECGAPGDTIKVNGRALESGESYTAVTIEYLAKGMHGYFGGQAGKMQLHVDEENGQALVVGQLVRKHLSRPRFAKEPVDLQLNFPDLSRKLRWHFQGTVNFNLADTRIENGPGYDESQLTRDEFIALKGEFRGKIGASSALHAFGAEAWLKYARSSTNDEPFVESEDLTTINLIYKLNALRMIDSGWYMPSLYLEGQAETEITRPDERDYHHLELTGTLGTRFQLFATLEAKLGIGVRDEMYDESNPVYGFEIGYEMVRTDLFSLMGSPFQMESKFSAFFGDVGRSNTVKGIWVNRFYLALIGPIFFNVTHELFFYRYSEGEYGLASDLTFGLSYHARTAVQMF